jgi:hypothetical protein
LSSLPSIGFVALRSDDDKDPELESADWLYSLILLMTISACMASCSSDFKRASLHAARFLA